MILFQIFFLSHEIEMYFLLFYSPEFMIPEFHDYLLKHHEMQGPPVTLFLAVDVFAARKVAYFFRRYRVEALFCQG